MASGRTLRRRTGANAGAPPLSATLLAVGLALACAAGAAAQEALRFEHLTVEDGLPDDTVNALAQDGLGFVWIATPDGLARFDGYQVRSYVHDPDDPASLPHNDVRTLAVDGRGDLWLGTRGGGLARYDAAGERFTVWRHREDDPHSLPVDYLSSLAFDRRGGLWVGTRTAGAALMDPASERFVHYPPDPEVDGALRGSRIGDLLVAGDGTVWLAGVGHGLYRFDAATGRFVQYLPREGDPGSLPDARVADLHEDAAGRLWIGTMGGLALWEPGTGGFRRWQAGDDPQSGPASGGIAGVADDPAGGLWLSLPGTGLQQLDPETGRSRLFRHHPTRRHSLAAADTSALMVDRSGVLWVGTGAGVDRHDPLTRRFESYQADPERPELFPDDDLWGIGQTADGALWLATDSGGVVRFDPAAPYLEARTWTSYRHDPGDPRSLAGDRIYCLLVDSSDRVWVGTAGGGLDLYDPERDAWIHHRHDPADPDSLSNDEIYSLTEGSGGRLWVGLNRGFDRLDPATGRFEHPAVIEGDPDGGMLATTFDVAEAPDGRVWIATFLNGLYSLDPSTREWSTYRPEEGNPESFPSMRINALLVDRRGVTWAGTNVGLFEHLREGPEGKGNRWRKVGRKQGLANENVSALHEGPDGGLWIGTSHGLYRLDPATGGVAPFFAEDGLPSSEVGWHALKTLADGRLAIGTTAGFALLDPSTIAARRPSPRAVLTGLELFNTPVPIARPGEPAAADGGLTLERSILVTEALTLGHRDRVVTFEFAGLAFTRPERVRYAYRLEGWDPSWLETTARRRSATYTNLPAGDYVFQVKAAAGGGEGDWGEPTPPLALTVRPPPWKTWWAYTLYALAGAALLAALVWSLHRRAEQQRARAEHEAAVNEQLRRVDKLKDEFLANTSHELRTPLHGMIGLAESLVDGAAGNLAEPAVHNLSMIVASGRRLGSLIDDLLDFSKLRHRDLALDRRPVDLRSLADVVLTLNRPLVGGKDLVLLNEVPADLPPADADESRIEQVLHNLVGNAVKFTPRGRITVGAERRGGELAVTVTDTGIGIGEADRERIFAFFEQVESDAARSYGGTGLGLAISRKLVELHGGRLTAESAPGEGSRFTFTLPVANGETAAAREHGVPGTVRRTANALAGAVSSPVGEEDGDAGLPAAGTRPGGGDGDGERFKVLVVDDEPVNRQVLVNQLALHDYRIVEAAGGEEALAAFERESPDLVLLDIMMPRMSGYDVCRRLREHRPPAEMPVIYLTAKNQIRDLLTGFETGANDYLTKPITKAELLARVRTHLELLDVHRNLERKVAERSEGLRRANEQLARMASVDGLTRIANRRAFDESLARAWADHHRRGAALSVIFVDVDCFKKYNDHYGHQRGDDTLVAVAACLSGSLKRAGDLAARYGGEEFAVLLPDTPAAGAADVARAVLDAVRGRAIPHAASEVSDHVTVSLGVATLVPRPVLDPGDLVELADRALYRAKQGGRDRIEVDEPSGPAA